MDLISIFVLGVRCFPSFSDFPTGVWELFLHMVFSSEMLMNAKCISLFVILSLKSKLSPTEI